LRALAKTYVLCGLAPNSSQFTQKPPLTQTTGFGGKVEAGESVRDAAAREIREEAGVEPGPLTWRGLLTFCFDDQPRPWEVHVFSVDGFEGEPTESDEMRPEWFEARLDSIPFDEMWADDRLWWPLLLRADAPLFQGVFAFERTHEMRWWRLTEVSALPGAPPLQLLEEAEKAAEAAAATASGCSGVGGPSDLQVKA
jgi:ADP-ribose pyrophosphatase YjhB (NUDIX family)